MVFVSQLYFVPALCSLLFVCLIKLPCTWPHLCLPSLIPSFVTDRDTQSQSPTETDQTKHNPDIYTAYCKCIFTIYSADIKSVMSTIQNHAPCTFTCKIFLEKHMSGREIGPGSFAQYCTALSDLGMFGSGSLSWFPTACWFFFWKKKVLWVLELFVFMPGKKNYDGNIEYEYF